MALWRRRLLAQSRSVSDGACSPGMSTFQSGFTVVQGWDRSLHQKDPSWPARESRRPARVTQRLSLEPQRLPFCFCAAGLCHVPGPCLWRLGVGVVGQTCLVAFLVASVWDLGVVTGVWGWAGREGRPWMGPWMTHWGWGPLLASM